MNGGGGIRTHGSGVSGEGETRSADYKSAALDPSATPPQEPQGTGVPWGNLLAFAFLGMEHERLQPIIGSVDDSAVLERDVRGEYTPIVEGVAGIGFAILLPASQWCKGWLVSSRP
jgi:hypothetical protein